MKVAYQSYVLLKEILDTYGPQEFGRVCQILLGITLKEMGFKISLFQLVARPDIIIEQDDSGYAIEVKAQNSSEVVIKEEDLNGVISSGHTPLLAILIFPSIEKEWTIINARKINPGKHNKISLERHSIPELEDKINAAFREVIKKYREETMMGSSHLKRILGYKKEKGV